MSTDIFTWQPLHWQHIEAVDLPLVVYMGEGWVPLRELAQSLGVETQRLTAAARSKRNNNRVRMISLLNGKRKSDLAVSRDSLVAISHRLTPGTNNRLLRFVESADRIAIENTLSALALRAMEMKIANQRRKEQEEARRRADLAKSALLANLMIRADRGEPYLELEKIWIQETGLLASTFFRRMRGHGLPASLQTMASELPPGTLERKRPIGRYNPASRDKPPNPPRVRLTEAVLHKVLDDLEAGIPKEQICKKYNVKAQTLRDIRKRRYSTAAFQAVIRARGSASC
jgi:hypothetical protein